MRLIITHGDFIGRSDMAVVSPTKRKALGAVHGLMWSGFGSAVASAGRHTDGRVIVAVGAVTLYGCDKEVSDSVDLIALAYDAATPVTPELAER